MTAIPRSRQKRGFIRSDKAAQLLARLAHGGRSKVSIIEEALVQAAREASLPHGHAGVIGRDGDETR